MASLRVLRRPRSYGWLTRPASTLSFMMHVPSLQTSPGAVPPPPLPMAAAPSRTHAAAAAAAPAPARVPAILQESHSNQSVGFKWRPLHVDGVSMMHGSNEMACSDAASGTFEQCWLPTDTPLKAVVVWVHGLNDHSSRFQQFVPWFIPHGIGVWAMDTPGHGRSVQDAKSRGLVLDVADLVDACVASVQRCKSSVAANVPVFVLGHSFGGLLAIQTVTQAAELVQGLVLHAPLLELAREATPSPAVTMLAEGLARLPFLASIPLIQPTRGLVYPQALLESLEAKLLEDSLYYHGKMRLGTGLAIRRALTEVQSVLPQVSVATLIQHGTGDKVCALAGSERALAAATVQDKQLRTYADGHHDLLRERPEITAAVQHDLLTWFLQRV